MTGNRPTLSGAEEPRRASKELQKRGDGCVKVYHLLSQLDDVSGYLDASEAATRLGQNGAGCCNELTRQLIVDRAVISSAGYWQRVVRVGTWRGRLPQPVCSLWGRAWRGPEPRPPLRRCRLQP